MHGPSISAQELTDESASLDSQISKLEAQLSDLNRESMENERQRGTSMRALIQFRSQVQQIGKIDVSNIPQSEVLIFYRC